MIYSPDINKKCALCQKAKLLNDNDGEILLCALKGKTLPVDNDGCRKFEYDIFKRKVKRRKAYISNVKEEDLLL